MMLKLVLLCLTLTGLHAAPVVLRSQGSTKQLSDGFRQGTEPFAVQGSTPNGFRQGTEPSRRYHMDRNTNLVLDMILEMDRRAALVDVPLQRVGGSWVRKGEPLRSDVQQGFRQGTEPSNEILEGFRQGTEPSNHILEGFRQGTEPSNEILEGFRQGTEPSNHILDGYSQGTEPSNKIPEAFWRETKAFVMIPDGFRQGTEPMESFPHGFRQGTEPVMSASKDLRSRSEHQSIPAGFRQGTEPMGSLPVGFRQGTEPIGSLPVGFRQGTETSSSPLVPKMVSCQGEVVKGICYEFNPTMLAFTVAQEKCRARSPYAELTSITSGEVHSLLVSLVTKGGRTNPVLTWVGATVKNQQAQWLDGSEWLYSDWMPGHPTVHTDRTVCVEMFKIGESWWTAADCDLQRASICSYPLSV